MKLEENNNAASTATTSPSEPKGNHADTGHSEYLRRQSEDARTAISAALTDAARSFSRGIDPSPLTRQHPWYGIAGAAAVGFAAALAMDHLKESRRRRAEELRLNPPPVPAANGHAPPAAPPQGIMNRVVSEAFAALKPVLMSYVSGLVIAKHEEEDDKSDAVRGGNVREDSAAQPTSDNAAPYPTADAGAATPPPT